jgi:Domain of Unknown Function (DUF1080)
MIINSQNSYRPGNPYKFIAILTKCIHSMRTIFLLFSLTIFHCMNIFAQQSNPEATEVWEPQPKVITPGKTPQDAPSDAIILFDGKDLSHWTDTKLNIAKWTVANGEMTIEKGSGNIQTKQKFGSCQLHIEWRTPSQISGSGQNRGNSGIIFMGRYELQVLDSYNNKTYSNGQAGSIYKQFIPLVNISKPPGEWQVFDVIFTAPKFNAEDNLLSPARFTVFQNGVLIQNNVELSGETVYIGKPSYKKHPEKEYLILQDHNSPVSYRNIWIRE